ncbi:hypothetical protein TWF696_007358 [Orbilia brochopaga]|uniref:Uncharacterized protein n=1 Tax=Orbilia brochopaga TaxID=3140254 RepID=A0AAV9UYF2_9PEZI
MAKKASTLKSLLGSSKSGSKSGLSSTGLKTITKGMKGMLGNKLGKNRNGLKNSSSGSHHAGKIDHGSKRETHIAVGVVFGIIGLVAFFIVAAIIVQRVRRKLRIRRNRAFGGLDNYQSRRVRASDPENDAVTNQEVWAEYDPIKNQDQDGIQLSGLTPPDSAHFDNGQPSSSASTLAPYGWQYPSTTWTASTETTDELPADGDMSAAGARAAGEFSRSS